MPYCAKLGSKIEDGSLAKTFAQLDAGGSDDEKEDQVCDNGSKDGVDDPVQKIAEIPSLAEPVCVDAIDASSNASKSTAKASASCAEGVAATALHENSASGDAYRFLRMMQETEQFINRKDILDADRSRTSKLGRKGLDPDMHEDNDQIEAAIDEELWTEVGTPTTRSRSEVLTSEPDIKRNAAAPKAAAAKRVTTLTGAMAKAMDDYRTAKGTQEVHWKGENRMVMKDLMPHLWRFTTYLRYGGGYGCDNKMLPNPLKLRAFAAY